MKPDVIDVVIKLVTRTVNAMSQFRSLSRFGNERLRIAFQVEDMDRNDGLSERFDVTVGIKSSSSLHRDAVTS